MAITTGWFPDSEYFPRPDKYGLNIFRKAGYDWTRESYVNQGIAYPYASTIGALALDTSARSTSGFSEWRFGPYNCVMTGVPTPQVPQKLLEGPIIRHHHDHFKERVRRGEILVSSYQRFQAKIEYSNGGVFTPFVDSTYRGHPTSMLTAYGFSPGYWDNMWGGITSVYLGNENLQIAGTIYVKYSHGSLTDNVTPYDCGWDDQVIQDFLNRLTSYVDSSTESQLIMENLSNANTATIDILTALAELPETVVSAIRGCRAILGIYRDAKNRDFRLADKAKKVRYEYEEQIFRIQFESRKEWLAARNDRARKQLQHKEAAAIKQAQNDLNKALADITSAIANVWLNFRYNITPNVILIEDCVKAHDTFGKMFRRWSNYERVSIEVPTISGWKCESEMELELRAFIKRGFKKVNAFSGFFRNFSMNIFKTAYELIPLSFVLDWVIPVGDFLSASLASNQSDYDEGCTISYKVNNQVLTYIHKTSKAQVKVTISGYKRSVINPYDYCRLMFAPDITRARVYDSLALSWSIAKSKFSSST